MLGNTDSNDSSKRYFIKIRSKDADKKDIPAYFEVQEKVDNEYKVTNKVNDISGDLTAIYISEFEYQKKKCKAIKVYLRDSEANELYILDLRISLLTRSLFNTLLSLKTFDGLKISLYQGKAKDGGVSHTKVSVRQHGELVNWKYRLEELPKIEEVKAGDQIIRVYKELDEFYLKELEALAQQIRAHKPASRPPAPAVVETQPEAPAPAASAAKTKKVKAAVEEEFADPPAPEDEDAPF